MRAAVVYGVSIAVHLGFAGVVFSIKKPLVRDRVAVVVREIKKAPPKAPAPEPPPPPARKAPPRRVAAAAPRAAAPVRSAAPVAAEAPSAPVADFGLTLAGGDGPALPTAPAPGRPAPKEEVRRAPPRPKVLAAPTEDEGCADPPVKPKAVTVVQPTYTDAARSEQIEGKVRVEISVGPDGAVTAVRIVQGLGYGLDEAALEAARGSTFEPGTRCGKPTAMTFTIGMRFTL